MGNWASPSLFGMDVILGWFDSLVIIAVQKSQYYKFWFQFWKLSSIIRLIIYQLLTYFGSELEKEIIQAKCHYTKAIVDGISFDLFDDAYVKVSFHFT